MGNVLAVNFDNEYGLLFVSLVDESSKNIEYHLVCTRLLQKEKSNIDDFLNSTFTIFVIFIKKLEYYNKSTK